MWWKLYYTWQLFSLLCCWKCFSRTFCLFASCFCFPFASSVFFLLLLLLRRWRFWCVRLTHVHIFHCDLCLFSFHRRQRLGKVKMNKIDTTGICVWIFFRVISRCSRLILFIIYYYYVRTPYSHTYLTLAGCSTNRSSGTGTPPVPPLAKICRSDKWTREWKTPPRIDKLRRDSA